MSEASKSVRKRKRRLTLSNAEAERKEDAQVSLTLAQERIVAQKAEFLRVLGANMGIISISAREIGIASKTVERWRKADRDFNDACMDEIKRQKGFVEGKLIERINAGDTRAITFYLRCKGRHATEVDETWIERIEVSGDPNNPVHVAGNINVEEKRSTVRDSALAKALAKAIRATPDLFEDDDEEAKAEETGKKK